MSESDEPTPAPATPSDPSKPSSPKSRTSQDAPPRRSLGRRITFWIGIALIGTGLSLLAYVAWQLWVTNWISHRAQREIASQLQEDWAGGIDNAPRHGEADALIRIPRFGDDYLIPVLEGTSQDILSKGFGHFEDTAPPGDNNGKPGNYALAGHRVTHGEPLRNMPDLRPGDKVIVETREHRYVYKLDTDPNDLIISFTGTWVLDQFPKNPKGGVGAVLKPDAPDPDCTPSAQVHCTIKNMYTHVITLTTCSEIFHTDNRMIAFGHLIAIVDKPVPAPLKTPVAP